MFSARLASAKPAPVPEQLTEQWDNFVAEEDTLSLQIGEPLNQSVDKSRFDPRFKRAIAAATLGGTAFCINEIPWYFNTSRDYVFFTLACFLLILAVGMIISAPFHFDGKQSNENGGISLKFFFVALVIVSCICSGAFLFFYRVSEMFGTGADRLGQCQPVDDALMSLGYIPPSAAFPHRGATGCGSARYGLFFQSVNHVSVYGVTSWPDQNRVLRALSKLAIETNLAPTKVWFYEKEKWIEERSSNGVIFGHRGPENLLRIAVVH
jgi:hypothetical protein